MFLQVGPSTGVPRKVANIIDALLRILQVWRKGKSRAYGRKAWTVAGRRGVRDDKGLTALDSSAILSDLRRSCRTAKRGIVMNFPGLPSGFDPSERGKRCGGMKEHRLLRELSLPRYALRRDEAAASISISPSLFDQWIDLGLMPRGRKIRGVVLWDAEELLMAWRSARDAADAATRAPSDPPESAEQVLALV